MSQPSSARREAAAEKQPLLDDSMPPARQPSPDSRDSVGIVQFEAPIFYVDKDEGALQVDIMRLGARHGRCSVRYETRDGSAIAGERYRASSGQIVFEAGDDMQTITLEMISSSVWSATQEFSIRLFEPEGCTIGLYLKKGRVKIIDKDKFPSNRAFPDGSDKPVEGFFSQWKLWFYFLKLTSGAPKVGIRAFYEVVVAQLHNVNFFLHLYLVLYLVDTVFNKDEEEAEKVKEELWMSTGPDSGRLHTAYIVAGLYFGPALLMALLEMIKVRVKLEAVVDEFLTNNLFTKYMNYTMESRLQVGPRQLEAAVLHQCHAVSEGYVAVIKLGKFVGRLIVVFLFARLENPEILPVIAAMPMLMAVFVALNNSAYHLSVYDAAERLVFMTDVLQHVCQHYPLIAEYKQRLRFSDKFLKAAEESGEAEMRATMVRRRVLEAARMLGPIFTAWHVYSKGPEVLAGTMPIGAFLASLRIFSELGEGLAEVYEEFMLICKAMVGVEELTRLFNLQTELPVMKAMNRKRRACTKKERAAMMDGSPRLPVDEKKIRADRVKLHCENVVVLHPGHESPVLNKLNVTWNQGDVIAIVGGPGSGKALLMRILSDQIFPQHGFVFIPSHLRVLFVPQTLQMQEESIWDEITFGSPTESRERVCQVLEGLKMKQTIQLLHEELKAGEETEGLEPSSRGATNGTEQSDRGRTQSLAFERGSLPHTEVAQIQLARALIMNPEVLIMQGPLSHFHDTVSNQMWRALLEHVRNRGYKLPRADRTSRRPRTLIFSPTSADQLRDVDAIWEMYGTRGASSLRVRQKDEEFEQKDYDNWRLDGSRKPGKASITELSSAGPGNRFHL